MTLCGMFAGSLFDCLFRMYNRCCCVVGFCLMYMYPWLLQCYCGSTIQQLQAATTCTISCLGKSTNLVLTVYASVHASVLWRVQG
jgi:hypothetical protein